MHGTPAEIAQNVIKAVKTFVENAIKPLADRMAAYEAEASALYEMAQRLSKPPEFTPEQLERIGKIYHELSAAVIPAPTPVAPAPSLTADEVRAIVNTAVACAAKEHTETYLVGIEERLIALVKTSMPPAPDAIAPDWERIEAHIGTLVKAVAAGIVIPPVDLAPMEARMDTLVRELMPKAPEAIEPNWERIAAEVKSEVKQAVAAIPEPKDGTSVTFADLWPSVETWLKQIPPPKDGSSVDVSTVAAMVVDAVKSQIAALPVPKDGTSFTLEEAEVLLGTKVATWALDFERRAQDVFRDAIAKMPRPKDGDPGLDGLGFDDFEIEHDGQRGFKFILARGEFKKEWTFNVPVQIYRDVYKEGTEYSVGDTATHAGSLWHCYEPTSDRPGAPNSKGWRLAVKRGADGKDLTAPVPKGHTVVTEPGRGKV